jgi:formylglycine-generating enzyme required for sulfatase activity
LPENEWCYQPKPGGSYEEGMTIPANVVSRKGYRLLTEAEWEYACRAGTTTSRYYGLSLDLLGKYAACYLNGSEKALACGSLLPNDLGLFDMLGNAYEWTQDHDRPDRPEVNKLFRDVAIKDETLALAMKRLFRGGSFGTSTQYMRSAFRTGEIPTYNNGDCGFRVGKTCE